MKVIATDGTLTSNLSPVTCTLSPMTSSRQQLFGLAIVVLLILLFVVIRHFWSAA